MTTITLTIDGEKVAIDCYYGETYGQWYAHLWDFVGVGNTAHEAALDLKSEILTAGYI